MSKYLLFNPYLGTVCGTFMFFDLIKYVPKKEYNNPAVMGFVLLKSCSTAVIGSVVPITTIFLGKELYKKYNKD